MATVDIPDPRRSSYGQDYWLHRCEGFRVESPDGEVGTVKGLRFRDSIEPELLEVRTGLFGRRLLLIPVERVERIFSNERRIILSVSSRFADPGVADRSQSERISRRSERRVTVAGLSKALATLIQAFNGVFRVGKRPA